MTTPEGKFKKDFCSKLKKLKCTCIQYQQSATTLAGFPDTIILLPESLAVFLEFKKSKTAKYRPGQKEWKEKLEERGFYHWFVYPENADKVLEEIKELI